MIIATDHLLPSGLDAPRWTPADDETLRAAYAAGGIRAAERAFPSRTTNALYHRAQRIGVRRNRAWTTSDERRLRDLWSEGETLVEIAAAVGHPPKSCYQRARELGIPCGAGRGWEYLTHAAKRTGFATSSLRIILRWAGVRLLETVSRPRDLATRRFHRVDPVAVDRAVERWLSTETLNAAATRHGMTLETLRRWLASAGITQPTSGMRARRWWRVDSTAVDRVVAAHGPKGRWAA